MGSVCVQNHKCVICEKKRRLLITHYTYTNIQDLARLHHLLGHRSVTLIAHGQVGAIPNHLRPYASQQFNQYGLQVNGSANQKTYQPKESNKHKAKPEKIIFNLLIDLLDKD